MFISELRQSQFQSAAEKKRYGADKEEEPEFDLAVFLDYVKLMRDQQDLIPLSQEYG